ncbi:OmpA family protein [Sphingomonas sp. dw_22]|uniref:OmpA family protein n=1 Tax=Sphingomonas sp. dw_22 TaxID=2721175 RepID=UPI001BD4D35E|nr:OmpA family protein [Sphingomonas sp. dw_22]
MKNLFLASLALGGIALTAQSAQAQSTAVSEEEARCFVSGVCKIDAEKKFSLTNISSAAPKSATAPKAAPPKAAVRRAAPRRSARDGTPARPVADRQSLDMRLSFELGSAQLTRDAMAQADIFAKVLKESAGASGRFLIEGHTDSIGSRAMNLDLSRQRAQSVVAYLVGRGVPASKLTAIGYGFAHPRDGLPASDPSNRRVEIVKN